MIEVSRRTFSSDATGVAACLGKWLTAEFVEDHEARVFRCGSVHGRLRWPDGSCRSLNVVDGQSPGNAERQARAGGRLSQPYRLLRMPPTRTRSADRRRRYGGQLPHQGLIEGASAMRSRRCPWRAAAWRYRADSERSVLASRRLRRCAAVRAAD